MLHQDHPADEPTIGFDRRRFVVLTTAALAAEWLADVPILDSRDLGSPPAGPALVPGYLRGSDTLVRDDALHSVFLQTGQAWVDDVRRGIDEELPLELVSSLHLDNVAPLQGPSAVVEVHGLLPPDPVRSDHAIRSIDLLVEIASDAQPLPTPFTAWTYERQPVEQLAGPTRFTIPVGADVTVRLAVRLHRVQSTPDGNPRARSRRTDVDERPSVFIVDLPAEDRWGLPRLREGVYAIPLSLEAQKSLPLPANRDWLVPLDLQFLVFSVRSIET